MDGRVARRFGVAWGAMAMLGAAVAVTSAAAVWAGAQERAVAATLAAAPPSAHELDLQQAIAVLPSVFLSDAQAAGLGLQIVPNGFDNLDPPQRDAAFLYPLPGQSPRSIIVDEFISGRFLAGRAQSFVRPGREREGKLGVVAWAFESEDGAQRAFRAMRDLAGRPARADGFAPVAAVYEDDGLGLSELTWVRGRLLLRVGFAVSDDDLAPVQDISRVLAALVDEQAIVAARQAGALAAEPTPAVPLAPDTLRGRLLALRVPDLALPGGFNTDRRALTGDPVFLEPSGGAGSTGPLVEELDAAGFVAGFGQTVRVTGQPRARFGLTTRVFPDEASARLALEAVVAAEPADRTGPSAIFPGARVVRGPNGDNYSDVWWVRGPLLLQAGVYSHRDVPQSPDARDALAHLLDARAVRW